MQTWEYCEVEVTIGGPLTGIHGQLTSFKPDGNHIEDSGKYGKLMVSKTTWYAHKHRSFPRTHSYGGEAADKCFAYALSVWREYYEQEIVPRWRNA